MAADSALYLRPPGGRVVEVRCDPDGTARLDQVSGQLGGPGRSRHLAEELSHVGHLKSRGVQTVLDRLERPNLVGGEGGTAAGQRDLVLIGAQGAVGEE